jgi:hypothetical protein
MAPSGEAITAFVFFALFLLVLFAILPILWPVLAFMLLIGGIVLGLSGPTAPAPTPSRGYDILAPAWGFPAEGLPCTIVLELRSIASEAPETHILERCQYCRRTFAETLARCPHCGAPG